MVKKVLTDLPRMKARKNYEFIEIQKVKPTYAIMSTVASVQYKEIFKYKKCLLKKRRVF